jgi:hypothetical protein
MKIATIFKKLRSTCNKVIGFLRWPYFSHEEYRNHFVLVGILAPVAVVGVVLVVNWISVRTQSFSQISALTERVSFKVTQPNLASIPVRCFRMATMNSNPNGECLDGVIRPNINVDVRYGRVGYGSLSITLVPNTDDKDAILASYEPENGGQVIALQGTTYLELDERCGGDSSGYSSPNSDASSMLPALPIWGKVSLGSEFTGISSSNPQPRLLLEGKIDVSARSIEFLPSILNLRSTLYPITSLDLPVASRLETFPEIRNQLPTHNRNAENKSSMIANWWGIAYIEQGKPAIRVEIATDTQKLALYRPNRHEADVIEVTILNQVFEDPNLIKLYKIFVVLFGVSVISKWASKAFRTKKREIKGFDRE